MRRGSPVNRSGSQRRTGRGRRWSALSWRGALTSAARERCPSRCRHTSRFEFAVTQHANLSAGERVRRLPRRSVSDLCLLANDFWLVDGVLLFSLFSGDGDRVGTVVAGTEAVSSVVEAFEAVWARATDHADYQPA